MNNKKIQMKTFFIARLVTICLLIYSVSHRDLVAMWIFVGAILLIGSIVEVAYWKTYPVWYDIRKVPAVSIIVLIVGLFAHFVYMFVTKGEGQETLIFVTIVAYWTIHIVYQWTFAKKYDLQNREEHLGHFLAECPEVKPILRPSKVKKVLRKESESSEKL